MRLFSFVTVLFLTTAVGCANNSATTTANSTGDRTCVARDGYSLTPVDSVGRFPASTPHGEVTTLKVCDGEEERVISLHGVKPGSIDDNQDMFLTDGEGHILTEGRVITLAKTPVKLGDLAITGVCVELWEGGCDPIPAVEGPVPPPAELDLGTSNTNDTDTPKRVGTPGPDGTPVPDSKS